MVRDSILEGIEERQREEERAADERLRIAEREAREIERIQERQFAARQQREFDFQDIGLGTARSREDLNIQATRQLEDIFREFDVQIRGADFGSNAEFISELLSRGSTLDSTLGGGLFARRTGVTDFRFDAGIRSLIEPILTGVGRGREDIGITETREREDLAIEGSREEMQFAMAFENAGADIEMAAITAGQSLETSASTAGTSLETSGNIVAQSLQQAAAAIANAIAGVSSRGAFGGGASETGLPDEFVSLLGDQFARLSSQGRSFIGDSSGGDSGSSGS